MTTANLTPMETGWAPVTMDVSNITWMTTDPGSSDVLAFLIYDAETGRKIHWWSRTDECRRNRARMRRVRLARQRKGH